MCCIRALLLFALAGGMRAAVPCHMPVDVPAGARLEDLARRYLGGSRDAIAIALATNVRTGYGFSYIANPDDLERRRAPVHSIQVRSAATGARLGCL